MDRIDHAYTVTATDRAKKIRADIKAARKGNELGAFPQQIKISTRVGYASQMSEINVTIQNAPAAWAWEEIEDEYGRRQVPSRAAKRLAKHLMRIVERHYTPDGKGRFADVYVEAGDLRLSAI